MTDYTELKRLLDACRAENCEGPREFQKACEALFDVCSIETIAELVADNERLSTTCEIAEEVIATESKAAGIATGRANLLENEHGQVMASFKNFHRSLCERFGYFHDEIDWQRDQASLEEHIAAQFSHVNAENGALRGQVEALQRGAGQLQDQNEALRKDAERYRWLRDGCGIVEYKAIAGSIGPGMLPSGQVLEDAIDAAMDKGERL